MDRRKALKALAIATGGAIILPRWMISCGASDSTLHHTSFSIAQQKILAGVADTIIPAGNTTATAPVGALSVGVDKYLLKVIDDCYDTQVQSNIKVQLKVLNEWAQSTHKKTFADCSQAEREKLLLRFSGSENKSENDFFDLVKSETIKGFNTSQKVMTEFLGYKVVPGHYYGCVDVNQKDHA